MKFNKLARELEIPVNELAERVKDNIPNANGGTELDEAQVQAIKALVTNSKKTSSKGAHSTSASGGANEVFETEAPSDTELGIAVLGGMLQEYENRIRGLTIAHEWINSHEETGDYPGDPIAAKLTETVCLLRSLNVPYQPPRPAIKSSKSLAGTEGESSGISMPPLVRRLLATAYPEELTDLDRDLPEPPPKASRPQLSASQ